MHGRWVGVRVGKQIEDVCKAAESDAPARKGRGRVCP